MKKLIIPIIIGLVAGLGGGSGFAYLQLSSRYVADSTRVAQEKAARDSVVADSVARDSVARAAAGHDTAALGADSAAGPLTPADSIRAMQTARAALRGEGAPPPAKDAHAKDAHAKDAHAKDAHAKDAHAKDAPGAPAATAGKAPAVGATKDATKDATKGVTKGVTKGATDADPTARMVAAAPEVAAAMRDVRNAALKENIPEQRLANIFAAMRAKEAAKVLDQMSDRDVRSILGLMSDRKAAEILTLLSPARAAAVTRGTAKPPEVTP